MNKKELVVVTKYFGYNFTGATLATHELVKMWSGKFNNITIITKNIGEYDDIENLKVKLCKNNFDIINNLKKIQNKNIKYYCDDHLSILLKLSNKKYFHTYHATWPEAKWNNYNYFVKSFLFIPLYKYAIKNSIIEVAVSEKYKENFVKKYNNNCMVIRNGLGRHIKLKYDRNAKSEKFNIVMIGNIDKRKYKLAPQLFEIISKENLNVNIDIYGRNLDTNLLKKIEKYDFVNYRGFSKNINIQEYKLLLSTSTNENLSIATCEGIKVNVPTLGFNVGAMDEIVVNGDNGFLIDNMNIEVLFEKLKFIVNTNYEFKFKDRKIEEFEWHKVAEKYFQIFMME